MSLEDELAELRVHVLELQHLIVSIIPDERVVHLDELHLVRMTIAERTCTHAFELARRYLEGGRYGFVVTPAKPRRVGAVAGVPTLAPAVVAYVERLRRLGMEIEVEAAPGAAS